MHLRSMPRIVAIALTAACFCLLVPLCEGAEQENLKSHEVPAPPPSEAIPVAEVAARATEVQNTLRSLSAQLTPRPAIAKIQNQVPAARSQIDLQFAGTMKILQESPAIETLQSQQKSWQATQRQTTGWLKVLTDRTLQLSDALQQLANLKNTWAETLETAQASSAPESILQQIEAVMAAIDAATTPLQAEHSDVLNLQTVVSQEISRCESAITLVSQAEKKAVGGILMRDSLPVWSAELWERARIDLPGRVHEIAGSCREDIQQYVRNPSKGMPFHVGFFLSTALLLSAVRRRVHHWAASENGMLSTAVVLDRPYAAAFIATMLVATGPTSPVPLTVQQLFGVLAFVSAIRLVQPVVTPGVMRGLYVMGIFFVLDSLRQVVAGTPLLEQLILFLETSAGFTVLGWSFANGYLLRIFEQARWSVSMQIFQLGAGSALFGLAVGFIAGSLGYMRLARLFASTVLGIGVLVLALYSCWLVLIGTVAFSLRVWPLRLLRMVQRHRDLLLQRTHRVLVWLAVAAGLSRSLEHLGLLQSVLGFGGAILATKLERGSISISLGDVLAFSLTVWVACLLSAFLRFLLQEEVYPRMQIPSGLSYATSRLLNYMILALGVVVGLGVMGVDLTKITVLASALGVGIGFGLQSVVNNFVSGLILLFERPIHVGDTIEVGDLLGEVRWIGIRASRVHTRQGADIIVPNAQLVTENVTNWTLSDRLRRIDLPVGVNYGAVPEKVIEVLERVADTHPDVLKSPVPVALFTSFGDSSINFELRAWTDQFEDWQSIRSDLSVAMYSAIQKAGMSFPFPQREVRMLHNPEEGSVMGPSSPGEASSLREGGPDAQAGEEGKTKDQPVF